MLQLKSINIKKLFDDMNGNLLLLKLFGYKDLGLTFSKIRYDNIKHDTIFKRLIDACALNASETSLLNHIIARYHELTAICIQFKPIKVLKSYITFLNKSQTRVCIYFFYMSYTIFTNSI